MIGIFLGEQNSGKTLSMTYFAYDYYKKGYKVYSNYNLEFPHEKITKKLIIEYTKNKIQLDKSIFLIDEIYLFLDSRSFGKKSNKLLTYFLLQTSKRNVHLFGTAQYFNTVEKRFRENCNFITYCFRVYRHGNNYYDISSNIRFLDDVDNLYIKVCFFKKNLLADFNMKTFYIQAKPIFNLYDTKELLDITED